MATGGVASDGDSLRALFEASPDPHVHTSAGAEFGLLLGLFALLAAPFSVMQALSLSMAGLAILLALLGVVATSRPNVAGGALAPLGLACSFVALAVVGLRYLGLDTAFGDDLVPILHEWLTALNSRLPRS